MKRYIKATSNTDILSIDIDINFVLVSTADIAATKILPLRDGDGKLIGTELGHYQDFAACMFEIIAGYGFVMKPGPKDPGHNQGDHLTRLPEPRSETSYYFWAAHESQINAKNVPRWIRVRISDHFQDNIDTDLDTKHKTEMDAFLNKNKLPETKQRQRYIMRNIVSDGDEFDTYEEVLNYWDAKIYKWMTDHGIDVSGYDKPDGSW